jgi:hypothetical protein
MLREVDRRAEERRSMQAVDEAVDDRAREQVQLADARQSVDGVIEEAKPAADPIAYDAGGLPLVTADASAGVDARTRRFIVRASR